MRWGEVQVQAVRKRSRLPHWETRQGIEAITFNLFDAVPVEQLARLKNDIAAIERERMARFGTLSPADTQTLHRMLLRQIQRLLDRGHGSCFMNAPGVADLVGRAIEYFDRTRYLLYAWCVMPNHVHVVARISEGTTLDTLLHSWKSYTSKEANRLLKRTGRFWEDDYFDRTMRNPAELRRWVGYVAGNPEKAGLLNWPHRRVFGERLAAVLE